MLTASTCGATAAAFIPLPLTKVVEAAFIPATLSTTTTPSLPSTDVSLTSVVTGVSLTAFKR